jgi:hypothetical protein
VITNRYGGLVLAMLAVTAVPVIAHQYVGWTAADARSLAVDLEVSGMQPAAPPGRGAWIERAFATSDWLEQRYEGPGGSVTLFLVRSYDAKRLYHHPELALLHGRDFERAVVVRTPEGPDIPVRVLMSATGVAAYALVYEDTVVESPVVFSLRQAGSLLFSPRRPMTLVLVDHLGAGSSGDTDPADSLAAALATRATRAFIDPAGSAERP